MANKARSAATELKISLTENDFRRLVRGEIVVRADDQNILMVHIALQDMGWSAMYATIIDAQQGNVLLRGDELQEKGGGKPER